MRRMPSIVLAAVAAVAYCTVAAAQTGEAETRAKTLVFGKVDIDAKKSYPRAKGLAEYLAGQMAPLGIASGKAVLFASDDDMVAALKRGAVDVTTETLHAAWRYREEAGAVFLLREWRRGVPSYRTVFLARNDSGIDSLDHFKGKRLAFEDSGSTSAYRVPLALLRAHGYDPVLDATRAGQPRGDAVRFAFAGSESNVLAWVHHGTADVGTVSDRDWDNPVIAPPAIRADLRIIHQSPPIIRSLVVARGDLPAALAAGLKTALIAMPDSEAGRQVLSAYYNTSRFDEIVGDVKAQLDESLRLLKLAGE